jgi:hypothetical protein
MMAPEREHAKRPKSTENLEEALIIDFIGTFDVGAGEWNRTLVSGIGRYYVGQARHQDSTGRKSCGGGDGGNRGPLKLYHSHNAIKKLLPFCHKN